MNLIEQVQYKAARIVSGCWQGTNREKLYDELEWGFLSERRWCRRMTLFYKILNCMAPSDLLDHIVEHSSSDLLDHILEHSLTYVSSRRNPIRPPFSSTGRYDNSFSLFV